MATSRQTRSSKLLRAQLAPGIAQVPKRRLHESLHAHHDVVVTTARSKPNQVAYKHIVSNECTSTARSSSARSVRNRVFLSRTEQCFLPEKQKMEAQVHCNRTRGESKHIPP